MSVGDVLVSRDLNAEEIRAAVALLFGIPSETVLVVEDYAELLNEQLPHPRVLCHRVHIPSGDFHTHLSFHEGDFTSMPRLETVKRLCAIVDSQCLISRSDVNPYSMVLVNGQDGSRPVHLDPERLDSTNEYVLLRD